MDQLENLENKYFEVLVACEAVTDVDLLKLDEKALDLLISQLDFDEK
jgi:hypothetical protein